MVPFVWPLASWSAGAVSHFYFVISRRLLQCPSLCLPGSVLVGLLFPFWVTATQLSPCDPFPIDRPTPDYAAKRGGARLCYVVLLFLLERCSRLWEFICVFLEVVFTCAFALSLFELRLRSPVYTTHSPPVAQHRTVRPKGEGAIMLCFIVFPIRVL